MYKLFTSSTEFPKTHEPMVQLIEPGYRGLEKFAADTRPHHDDKIAEYLSAVKPEQGYSYLLILALGSSDYYGCNRNGDWFDDDELQTHHGSFETNPACLYRHHQNKNPENSIGKVVKSFWNPTMKRVEIIVRMENDKAPDVVEKLREGIPVATSMGCRVKCDICSECGNQAKSRAEYCDHLRYQMRHIFEDGRQIYAVNHRPSFFDISLVFRPADRTSYVLKKVAGEAVLDMELTNSATAGDIEEKIAALRKISDITKIIRGLPVRTKIDGVEKDLVKNYRDHQLPKLIHSFTPASPQVLDKLSDTPVITIIKVMRRNGHILSTPEISKLILAKKLSIAPSEAPESIGRVISMIMPFILDFLSGRPDVIEKITTQESDFYEKPEDEEKVEEIVNEFSEERKYDDESLAKKASSTQYNYTQIPEKPKSFSWGDAVRAWRELSSMDGPARHETVKIRLPNGSDIVMSREEILHSIVADYGANLSHPLRTPFINVPMAATAAATGILAGTLLPGPEESVVEKSPQFLAFPGMRGKIVKQSSSNINLPGVINSIAIDYCLSGGYTPSSDLDYIKTADFDFAMKEIDNYIRYTKKILKL